VNSSSLASRGGTSFSPVLNGNSLAFATDPLRRQRQVPFGRGAEVRKKIVPLFISEYLSPFGLAH